MHNCSVSYKSSTAPIWAQCEGLPEGFIAQLTGQWKVEMVGRYGRWRVEENCPRFISASTGISELSKTFHNCCLLARIHSFVLKVVIWFESRYKRSQLWTFPQSLCLWSGHHDQEQHWPSPHFVAHIVLAVWEKGLEGLGHSTVGPAWDNGPKMQWVLIKWPASGARGAAKGESSLLCHRKRSYRLCPL